VEQVCVRGERKRKRKTNKEVNEIEEWGAGYLK
jgi:hypothetical protein